MGDGGNPGIVDPMQTLDENHALLVSHGNNFNAQYIVLKRSLYAMKSTFKIAKNAINDLHSRGVINELEQRIRLESLNDAYNAYLKTYRTLNSLVSDNVYIPPRQSRQPRHHQGRRNDSRRNN